MACSQALERCCCMTLWPYSTAWWHTWVSWSSDSARWLPPSKHLLPVLATTLSCRFERLNKSMSYLPCALSAASIVSLVWTAIYIQAILRALLNQRKNVYCRIPEYACIPGVDPRYHCSSNQTSPPSPQLPMKPHIMCHTCKSLWSLLWHHHHLHFHSSFACTTKQV